MRSPVPEGNQYRLHWKTQFRFPESLASRTDRPSRRHESSIRQFGDAAVIQENLTKPNKTQPLDRLGFFMDYASLPRIAQMGQNPLSKLVKRCHFPLFCGTEISFRANRHSTVQPNCIPPCQPGSNAVILKIVTDHEN